MTCQRCSKPTMLMTKDNKKYYECTDVSCGHVMPIEGDVISTNVDRLNHVKNLSGEKITCGIVIGRFNPIHSSHELLIQTALEQYPKNHIVFVGSSNHPMSFRHIFNYTQRTSYIKEIFPDIRLMGLPDYRESDVVWINYIMDYIEAVFGGKIHHGPFFDAHLGNVSAQEGNIVPRFFFGSYEDSLLFDNRNFEYTIVNRFKEGKGLSASEIRDRLINKADIKDIINPKICDKVLRDFQINIEKLKAI